MCESLAPAIQGLDPEQEQRTTSPAPQGEFTLRDEANALTAFAFRSGILEDLHAGKDTPPLDDPGLSRITDDEMRRLMLEASKKLAEMLRLKRDNLTEYAILIRSYHRMYCRKSERD